MALFVGIGVKKFWSRDTKQIRKSDRLRDCYYVRKDSDSQNGKRSGGRWCEGEGRLRGGQRRTSGWDCDREEVVGV